MLITKITNKITAWSSRHFSYSARVRIINSVLVGVISFWSRIFILPQQVIRRVTAICRNFLWGSTHEFKKMPLVRWEEICQKKKHGGPGIKNISN
ncbi:hypothetical protein DM860_012363 [Cuscuta australis]|uniref:Reverse transcriptase zinc-binding domain-containing protein n=1 Tax=Cuscuta australis TaxID=267555 RepID=A0A328DT32_9ASTE|nr:hypothetical protein DM860_012363 [Cuscuta australis]